jgi:hypothetical protein
MELSMKMKNTQLERPMVMTENDLNSFIQYEKFLNLLKDKTYNVDLAYMNEHKIKDVPKNIIDHFNDTLMVCKIEYNYSLLTILTKLSEEFMDTSKIKSYINTDVKWELINEVRERYPKIRNEYPEASTSFLF